MDVRDLPETKFFEHSNYKKGSFSSFMSFTTPDECGCALFAPPHCQTSIEFILCGGLKGSATISGRTFHFDGDTVIYVPPTLVHTISYESGHGGLHVMKIEPELLSEHIDIRAVLAADSLGLECFSPINGSYKEIFADCAEIDAPETPLHKKLALTLGLFDRLTKSGELSDTMNDDLRRITDWTNARLATRITLSDAAAYFGYSRTYFCRKFKEASGDSYLHYVNLLRISKASSMLALGENTSTVCRECGFSDESYFIRAFTKTLGVTPARYRAKHFRHG